MPWAQAALPQQRELSMSGLDGIGLLPSRCLCLFVFFCPPALFLLQASSSALFILTEENLFAVATESADLIVIAFSISQLISPLKWIITGCPCNLLISHFYIFFPLTVKFHHSLHHLCLFSPSPHAPVCPALWYLYMALIPVARLYFAAVNKYMSSLFLVLHTTWN